jgi:hypothetical protein
MQKQQMRYAKKYEKNPTPKVCKKSMKTNEVCKQMYAKKGMQKSPTQPLRYAKKVCKQMRYANKCMQKKVCKKTSTQPLRYAKKGMQTNEVCKKSPTHP